MSLIPGFRILTEEEMREIVAANPPRIGPKRGKRPARGPRRRSEQGRRVIVTAEMVGECACGCGRELPRTNNPTPRKWATLECKRRGRTKGGPIDVPG